MTLRVKKGVQIPTGPQANRLVSLAIESEEAVLGPAAATTSWDLEIDLICQDQTEWCWVACLAMVSKKNGGETSQCNLVNKVFDYTGSACCLPSAGSTGSCNRPACRKTMAAQWNIVEYAAAYSDGPLAFGDIENAFGQKQPILVEIRWRNNPGSHAILLTGSTRADRLILVNDPSDTRGFKGPVRYDDLKSVYFSDGYWNSTWLLTKRSDA